MYSIQLDGTVFVTTSIHPEDTHRASRWRIRIRGDEWSETVLDTGFDEVNLLTYTTPVSLTEDVVYEYQMQYFGNFNIASEWSEPVAFDQNGEWEEPVETGWENDPDTIDPNDPCDRGPTADWDEHCDNPANSFGDCLPNAPDTFVEV